MFTSVKDTDVVISGDKLSPVLLLPLISIAGVVGDEALFLIFIDSMTPAINLSSVTRTPTIIKHQ